jgi:hypothetical protein
MSSNNGAQEPGDGLVAIEEILDLELERLARATAAMEEDELGEGETLHEESHEVFLGRWSAP